MAWERLRLVYNLILGAEVLIGTAVLRSPLLTNPGCLLALAIACLAANVCFSTGVVAEFYLARLGLPRTWIRRGLFGIGMLISVPIAGLSIHALSHDFMPWH